MDKHVIAVVPAAGVGKRFDASGRKTFVTVNGVPLLVRTLQVLQREPSIHEIIPVLRRENIEEGFTLAKEHRLSKVRRIAGGGEERQDSIYSALRLIEEDGEEAAANTVVLVHDGARPVIPEGTIAKLLRETEAFDGVLPGIPVKDTLKEVSDGGVVLSTLDRERVRAVQTPQAFYFKVLKKAYDTAYRDNVYATDDAALVERTGGKIKIIEGSPYNIKITTQEDLGMVEYFIKMSGDGVMDC